MKYFSMRAALMLFVAFVAFMLCSCSDGTKHVLVTPLLLNEYTGKYIVYNKEVWRVPQEELSMAVIDDTLKFSHVYDSNTVTYVRVINKIEEN